jgi:hypothetical protein
MRVYETFRPMDRDDSNMATLSEGRSGGYGLGSWATLMLALVSVGVSAWA